MEGGPPFSKKGAYSAEMIKLSCEISSAAGKRSPLQASPPCSIKSSHNTASMSSVVMNMMPPIPSKSLAGTTSCNPITDNLSSPNPNPNPSPNPSPRGINISIGPNPNPNHTAEHSHLLANLYPNPNPNHTAEHSHLLASLYPNPNPNFTAEHSHTLHHLHPKSASAGCGSAAELESPSPDSRNANPNPNSRSTADPRVFSDLRYKYSINSGVLAEKSPLNHSLNHSAPAKNYRHPHEQPLLDDQQLGFMSDDQLFGGFRLLAGHASSPYFSEGLQESWSDHRHINLSRQALMSPAPEITGLGDLQEAEMSSFSAYSFGIYPPPAGAAPAASLPGGRPPQSLAFTADSPYSFGKYPPSEAAAAPGLPAGDDQPASLASTTDSAAVQCGTSSLPAGFSLAHSCGDDQRRPSPARANVEPHLPAGDGGPSSVVDMSSSSASEAQEDDEDSGHTLVGAQAKSTEGDFEAAMEIGTPSAPVDNKPPPCKKPRKKGQKRVREARVAFVTKSEVEHLEDGYRWRKYGQKAVKNSPHPRSYYRCTNSKCFVKKRVERSNEDPSLVVTTYEGQHTHHSPAFLRGSNMQLDPDPPINILNNNNVSTSFIPWQSPLIMSPTNSIFSTSNVNIAPNYLFSKPLIPLPSLIPRFPPTSSSSSTPLSSLPSLDPTHDPARHIPMHHNFMHANSDQRLLMTSTSTTHIHDASRAFVDKGLLDDMLPLACAARKPSSSPSP